MIDVLLVAFGAINLAYGSWALFDAPRAARLVHLRPERPSARGEVRALYGGAVASLGVATLWALRSPDGPTILRVLAVFFVGLTLGRAVSLLFDGRERWTVLLFLGEGLSAGFLARAAHVIETS